MVVKERNKMRMDYKSIHVLLFITTHFSWDWVIGNLLWKYFATQCNFFCRKPLRVVVLAAILVFLASNLACAVAVHLQSEKFGSEPMYLLYVRVAINDSLFIIFAIALSVCIFRMTKMPSSSLVLEAKVWCVLFMLLQLSVSILSFHD